LPTKNLSTKNQPAEDLPAKPDVASSDTPQSPVSIVVEASHQTDLENAVETPKNVLPFRPINDPKSPALSPVENSAFNELARQLSARLDSENGNPAATPVTPDAIEAADARPSTPEPNSPTG
jgi:hypothetical protein